MQRGDREEFKDLLSRLLSQADPRPVDKELAKEVGQKYRYLRRQLQVPDDASEWSRDFSPTGAAVGSWRRGPHVPRFRSRVLALIAALRRWTSIRPAEADGLLQSLAFPALTSREEEVIYGQVAPRELDIGPTDATLAFLQQVGADEWTIEGSMSLSVHPNLSKGWSEPNGVSVTAWPQGDAPIQFPQPLRDIEEEFWGTFRRHDPPEKREKSKYPTKWHIYRWEPPLTDIGEELVLHTAPMSYVTWAAACRARTVGRGEYISPLDEITILHEGRRASLREHFGSAIFLPECKISVKI